MKLGVFDGELSFETSDERVLTYRELKHSASSRWQGHEIIGAPPRREKLGADTGSLSFTVHLSAASGVSPDTEAEKWMRAAKDGRTGYLVIGGRVVGGTKWSVTKVQLQQLTALQDGRTLSADITVNMEAYT